MRIRIKSTIKVTLHLDPSGSCEEFPSESCEVRLSRWVTPKELLERIGAVTLSMWDEKAFRRMHNAPCMSERQGGFLIDGASYILFALPSQIPDTLSWVRSHHWANERVTERLRRRERFRAYEIEKRARAS
jgi:hypothetical protein